MTTYSRHIPSLLLLVLLTTVGCSPPSAELIDSPIVDELREGLDNGDESFDHSSYEQLLKRHVDHDAGTVDYESLQDDEEQLDTYLASIADADLTRLPEDEQHALLLNAYNGYTLSLILDHYPEIDSIRDISSPWTTERYEVGGYTLSLDQIEHQIIRPMYRDPRIHFAVNCAAVDCPHLAEFAYTGDELDAQLDERTEATLGNSKFVRIEDDTLYYTRVMHWYESDFVDPDFKDHAPNVAQYISPRSTEEIARFVDDHDGEPPASPLEYDWGLNDAR